MKVLHVIARMNVGGTARYLSMLSKGLTANGFESAIATGYVQGAEAEDSSVKENKLHRLPDLGRAINLNADLKAMRQLKLLVAQEKPDVIHSHTFKAGFIVRLQRRALNKAAGKNLKFVHTFHGHLLEDPEFKGLRKLLIIWVEKYLAKRTDILVTVGQKVSDNLLARKIGISNQYRNIPPGVLPLKIIDKSIARNQLGLEQHAKVVGWIARITGVKNPHLAAQVTNEFHGIQFIFGGDGDLINELKSELSENSKVYGWVDASIFLSACDAIFSTSENEGMPIALIEAQLAGIPVVATNVGSVSEVVIDGETGYVTDKSKYQIIHRLQELLSDDSLSQRMGVSAVMHASSKFSPEVMVQKHIDLYRVLV